MCMSPGCGGGSRPPSNNKNSYTPKKLGGGRATKGSYTPKSRATVMSSFGKPTVRMSFSGRK